MDIRAWGVGALVLVGGIGAPFGGEESNAARAPLAMTRATLAGQVDQAVLVVGEQWVEELNYTAEDYVVRQLEPVRLDSSPHPRNPAGRLVLPAPQTSHAPAF